MVLAVDEDFLVELDFLVEDDFFLVEVVLCVELDDFELVTALSTSSTLQDPDPGWHSTALSTSVLSTEGDTLPATAETSSRAKVEMLEMLRILDERYERTYERLMKHTQSRTKWRGSRFST